MMKKKRECLMFMIQLLIVLGLTFYQIPMVITQKVEKSFI